MVFSSILFLFRFLPIMLVLYFVSPKKLRNLILFIGSLIFYAWGEPVYVVLMLFSTIVDYTHGMLVEKFKNQNKYTKAKLVVASSMIINLALLCVFKYADFVVININNIFDLNIKL
ncbi:MAG: MBOAT family protein, partial [Lachnospiraceae bacterium]|nr:MBOAT family protein [Lachnospiraceae bacterium]